MGAPPRGRSPGRVFYFGGMGSVGGAETEQMSLMHWTPELAPQQSLVFAHFSYSAEQPEGTDPHTNAPPSSPARQ
jgi:hypothetical protein